MNAKDLELKIAGLEKAIKEHKDFTGTYEADLKETQKQFCKIFTKSSRLAYKI